MTSRRRFPAEFVLAAACCRWPPGAVRDAAVRAAAAGVIDWDRFLRISKRQRVDGLAHAALGAAAIELPAVAAGSLALRAQRILKRNLALAAETARLQALFDAAGIPVMTLKGMALAQLAFGTLELKHSQDIDLLIGADRAGHALELIERQGYIARRPAPMSNAAQRRTVMQYAGEVALLHPVSRTMVELRWRLADSPSLLAGIDVNSGSQTVTLSENTAPRTLCDNDQFAYLCVHGAGHGWGRLQWLADLNAFIGARGDADIERLYEHARARGSGICAGLALLLCQRLLARRIPAGLADAINGSVRLRILAALAVNVMVGPDAETEYRNRPFGSTRIAGIQFLLGGWENIAAQFGLMAVRIDDRLRYPLPAPLRFLYPLSRLPMWVWRRSLATPSSRTKRQRNHGPV